MLMEDFLYLLDAYRVSGQRRETFCDGLRKSRLASALCRLCRHVSVEHHFIFQKAPPGANVKHVGLGGDFGDDGGDRGFNHARHYSRHSRCPHVDPRPRQRSDLQGTH